MGTGADRIMGGQNHREGRGRPRSTDYGPGAGASTRNDEKRQRRENVSGFVPLDAVVIMLLRSKRLSEHSAVCASV